MINAPAMPLPSILLAQAAQAIETLFGITYPPERAGDLQTNLERTAAALHDDVVNLTEAIVSGRIDTHQQNALAQYLTVSETHFWRDPSTWRLIEEDILWPLIEQRRTNIPYLRLWSAGCCTGEEAYSLAIAVDRLLPQHAGWNISILGTDINDNALTRARSGSYRSWSFRNSPSWLRANYFTEAEGDNGNVRLRADIRQMVRFRNQNLVADNYPSPATDINDMDLILCRNVLMYFGAERFATVAAHLSRALAPGGALILGSAEAARALFPDLEWRTTGGCPWYRRPTICAETKTTSRSQARTPCASRRRPAPRASGPVPSAPAPIASPAESAAAAARTARQYADYGNLEEALHAIRIAVRADRTASEYHLFEAIVLHQLDRLEEAMAALRRCLFLDADVIFAHYLTMAIELRRGRPTAARRSLGTVTRLLNGHADTDIVPDAPDRLSVGELKGLLQPLQGALA